MFFIAKVDFKVEDQSTDIYKAKCLRFVILEQQEQIEQCMSFPVENETFKFYSLCANNELGQYLSNKPLHSFVYNSIAISSSVGFFLVKSFADDMSEIAIRRFNKAFETSVKVSQGKVVKFPSEIYDYVDHVRSVPKRYFSLFP